ncbi:ABC transporter permease subunit [Clostridium oryzae]|uniref:ABC-2 family transporter protein n=1 Tax=Clostridium oryzae TaxID=1450648 RepID=A0A1V4IWK2_9CLOT|nr:ABC transporter permease subunit [Clostridium oryzae]OPJ63797.1 ABC-2 family transporter protein [Clostridium oryzae]
MNMFLHELKSLRKSTIIWTCSLIAMSAMFLSIYPSILDDAADYKKMLGSYPAPVRAMLGINMNYVTSILGFYSMVFSFITLCGAIQAMNIGVSILTKESRERTADFLLVKPVSRSAIVSAKLLAAFTVIAATDVAFYAVTIIIANSVKTTGYDGKLFFMINLTLFFLQLIFLALGLIVSVFFKKLKSVLPISLGTVFGLYMIGALIAADKNNDAARIISPFKYFDTTYIIKNGSYEGKYLIASAVIIVLSVIAGYIIYIKKDIHAVS